MDKPPSHVLEIDQWVDRNFEMKKKYSMHKATKRKRYGLDDSTASAGEDHHKHNDSRVQDSSRHGITKRRKITVDNGEDELGPHEDNNALRSHSDEPQDDALRSLNNGQDSGPQMASAVADRISNHLTPSAILYSPNQLPTPLNLRSGSETSAQSESYEGTTNATLATATVETENARLNILEHQQAEVYHQSGPSEHPPVTTTVDSDPFTDKRKTDVPTKPVDGRQSTVGRTHSNLLVFSDSNVQDTSTAAAVEPSPARNMDCQKSGIILPHKYVPLFRKAVAAGREARLSSQHYETEQQRSSKNIQLAYNTYDARTAELQEMRSKISQLESGVTKEEVAALAACRRACDLARKIMDDTEEEHYALHQKKVTTDDQYRELQAEVMKVLESLLGQDPDDEHVGSQDIDDSTSNASASRGIGPEDGTSIRSEHVAATPGSDAKLCQNMRDIVRSALENQMYNLEKMQDELEDHRRTFDEQYQDYMREKHMDCTLNHGRSLVAEFEGSFSAIHLLKGREISQRIGILEQKVNDSKKQLRSLGGTNQPDQESNFVDCTNDGYDDDDEAAQIRMTDLGRICEWREGVTSGPPRSNSGSVVNERREASPATSWSSAGGGFICGNCGNTTGGDTAGDTVNPADYTPSRNSSPKLTQKVTDKAVSSEMRGQRKKGTGTLGIDSSPLLYADTSRIPVANNAIASLELSTNKSTSSSALTRITSSPERPTHTLKVIPSNDPRDRTYRPVNGGEDTAHVSTSVVQLEDSHSTSNGNTGKKRKREHWDSVSATGNTNTRRKVQRWKNTVRGGSN